MQEKRQFKTEGLIIKEQTVGESDRLVTVLTKDEGVIRAFARRAKNIKDSKSSATQLLCYSRLTIYRGKDKYIISDAFPQEVFFDLRTDIARLALAQYFCELVYEIIPEGVNAEEYLRVTLNSLHFLAKNKRPELLLKSITELRLLTIAGYMPNLVCCADCGEYEAPEMYFLVNSGTIYCGNCFKKTDEPYAVLHGASLRAMRHIIYSDVEKLYSFSVSNEAQKELANACEAYTLSVLQRRPKTLDFYASLSDL